MIVRDEILRIETYRTKEPPFRGSWEKKDGSFIRTEEVPDWRLKEFTSWWIREARNAEASLTLTLRYDHTYRGVKIYKMKVTLSPKDPEGFLGERWYTEPA